MDPATLQPHEVLDGIRSVGALSWSPDSRSLALSGELPGKGSGTWIVVPASSTVQRIGKDGLAFVSFSPDGTQIAGILDQGSSYPPKRQIVIVDVPR